MRNFNEQQIPLVETTLNHAIGRVSLFQIQINCFIFLHKQQNLPICKTSLTFVR